MLQFPLTKMLLIEGSTEGVNHLESFGTHGRFLEKRGKNNDDNDDET